MIDENCHFFGNRQFLGDCRVQLVSPNKGNVTLFGTGLRCRRIRNQILFFQGNKQTLSVPGIIANRGSKSCSLQCARWSLHSEKSCMIGTTMQVEQRRIWVKRITLVGSLPGLWLPSWHDQGSLSPQPCAHSDMLCLLELRLNNVVQGKGLANDQMLFVH